MRLLCACLATLFAVTAPLHTVRAAEKSEPSQISVYAGKYTGTISYSGLLSGRATGVFKASSTQEKGSYKVTSTASSPDGLTFTFVESFRFNGRKLRYSLSIAGLGDAFNGSGVGTFTASKSGLHFSVKVTLTNGFISTPATVKGFFLLRPKGMLVTSQINYGERLALMYKLEKKGK